MGEEKRKATREQTEDAEKKNRIDREKKDVIVRKRVKKGIAIGKTRQPERTEKRRLVTARCHRRGAIPLIELLEAKSVRALTEAATADVQAVLVDETVTVATHTAAGRTLALVVGVAVIESGVTHVCKGWFFF